LFVQPVIDQRIAASLVLRGCAGFGIRSWGGILR
jgi:hypothetical protein